MPSVAGAKPDTDEAIRVIVREDKGLMIAFHPDCVVKRYDISPTLISVAERDRRFRNEIAAYQRFQELGCPFVPQLIDYSFEGRWLSIVRVRGENLLVLCLSQELSQPIGHILAQIDEMNDWLRNAGFGDMENSIKDMILDEFGTLHLVDFEPYSRGSRGAAKPDIYNALIEDVLHRIFIRRGRTAKLTPQFIRLSAGILSRRPTETIRFALHYLVRGLGHLVRFIQGH